MVHHREIKHLDVLRGRLSMGLDGYLQTEILMRPPWVPIPMIPEEKIDCRPGEHPEIRFFVRDAQVARCLY